MGFAAEIHVSPDESTYSSIQKAITDAVPGDTIVVHNGFYNEAIDLYKQVHVIGKDNPILSFSGSDDIVSITADNCTVNGFIIQNASNASFSGINIESNNNLIQNNVIKNITGKGLSLFYASNNKIYNNSFLFNGISIIGLKSHWTTHSIINNTVNSLPILYYVNNDNLSIINISAGQLILANCSSCTIANNSITKSGEAVTLGYSNQNTVIQNHLSFNRIGLRIQYSSNNTISANTLSENTYGFYITHSFDNEIMKNTLYKNSKYGCWICCNSKRNQLFQNNFSMNANSAYDIFQNTWSKKGVGNYWSDYRGTDTNNDGIGETPYEILPSYGESIDPYPIVSYELLDSSSANGNDSSALGIIIILCFYCLLFYFKKGGKK